MISKKERVSKTLFGTIRTQKKTYFSRFFTLSVTRDSLIPVSKFSVVVSKAVLKKAVDRNKIKRRVYSIIRKHKTLINKGFISIFYLKKDVTTLNFKSLEVEVVLFLKKALVCK